MSGNRFDPAPVLAYIRADEQGLTDEEVADRLGVATATAGLYRRGMRGLSMQMADRVAIRLGLHPTLLWPEWAGAVCATEKACRTCGQVKPLEAYHPHPTSPDGRVPTCAACKNGRLAAQRAARRRRGAGGAVAA